MKFPDKISELHKTDAGPDENLSTSQLRGVGPRLLEGQALPSASGFFHENFSTAASSGVPAMELV